ncbi:putative sulfate exporter family transporter [Nocardiopsis sp. RSe5-2]|uniref:Sulfate exporter family transporter n=1 Tax=Nocardiopsis endophytica TaxID=3018445 RepID=A0ABT4TZT8_9ACTN|nr:putative sulfate exporter family transporter [Nocardiopsis endophytica]MDA2810205.1 putative sulfate exporter family transporter [Nocardiopsis endophytica]
MLKKSPSSGPSPSRIRVRLAPLMPGALLVAAGVAGAMGVHAVVPGAGTLVVALVLGAVLANAGLVPGRARPGLKAAAKTPMRAGIVLLGLGLSLPDVLALGGPVLLVVAGGLVATFGATVAMGRVLGIGPERRMLIAAGVSVCGASAVAAANDAVGGDDDDVAAAVALVTVFGTIAIPVLPALAAGFGLGPDLTGMWVGASVHEVGQVAAAAGAVGGTALAAAVVVKLTRVVLLAPLMVVLGVWRRRRADVGADGGDEKGRQTVRRPPLVPLFVVGFLAAAALGGTGWLPEGVLVVGGVLQTVLLSAGLFAMGTGVHLPTLAKSGARPLALGAAASAFIAAVTLGGLTAVA